MTLKTEIIPLTEITDLRPVARGLRQGMLNELNRDLSVDFAFAQKLFDPRRPFDDTVSALEGLQAGSREGLREKFVTFAGPYVVGMSAVEMTPHIPPGYERSGPNAWLFLYHPWRNMGIGKQVLQRHVEVVDERFGGKAWTVVRKENTPSRRAVERVGFNLADYTFERKPRLIYTYDASRGRRDERTDLGGTGFGQAG